MFDDRLLFYRGDANCSILIKIYWSLLSTGLFLAVAATAPKYATTGRFKNQTSTKSRKMALALWHFQHLYFLICSTVYKFSYLFTYLILIYSTVIVLFLHC